MYWCNYGFSLNDALLAKVVAVMAESPCQLRVLGKRGLRRCEERGLNVQESDSMPTRLGAVARTASALLESLFVGVQRGEVAQIEVVFARPHGPASYEPFRQRLFPPLVEPAVLDGAHCPGPESGRSARLARWSHR